MIERRETHLAALRGESDTIGVFKINFIAHALVCPSNDPEDLKRYDREVEAVAIRVAWGYEESLGAVVKDVSKCELARKAGLADFPGFDLISRRPDGIELFARKTHEQHSHLCPF